MRGTPRARSLAGLAALLAAPLLTGGCGARSELPAGAAPEAGACAAPRDPCDAATPCCTGACSDGVCPLRLALVGDPGAQPETLLAALLAERAVVTRIQASGTADAPLDPPLLARFDVLVLERLTRPYDPIEAAALFSWVSAGGGLSSLTGYAISSVEEQRPNSLLAPFGLQYTDQDSTCAKVPLPDTGSPVTAGVGQLEFCNGYHVSDAGQLGGTDLTLASSTGAPVLIAQERGLGRVLAWGDDWIAFDDQLDDDGQRFWRQALRWLGGP